MNLPTGELWGITIKIKENSKIIWSEIIMKIKSIVILSVIAMFIMLTGNIASVNMDINGDVVVNYINLINSGTIFEILFICMFFGILSMGAVSLTVNIDPVFTTPKASSYSRQTAATTMEVSA